MRRLKTPDWTSVGWHYKGIHRLGSPWHNRLWVRAKGLGHLPEGGVVLAANHSSWWDPIALQLTLPRPVGWLAKKEMMGNRFNRWFFFDKGGCIPVDRSSRNPEALAAAVRALREGRIIGVFPEGTRHQGPLGPTKTGVARLALAAGVPVLPVGLATERFWGPDQKAPRLAQSLYLNVGAPLRLEGDPASPDDARRGTDLVMARVWDLLVEARAARDRADPWPSPESDRAWTRDAPPAPQKPPEPTVPSR